MHLYQILPSHQGFLNSFVFLSQQPLKALGLLPRPLSDEATLNFRNQQKQLTFHHYWVNTSIAHQCFLTRSLHASYQPK